MTFALANFAPGGQTSKPLSGFGTATLKGAPSLWMYATADTIADVNDAGYFNDAVRHLNAGDFILATCGAGNGGTPAPVILFVNAVDKTAGTVDVSDGTTVSVTDTD